jgi:predicted hydrolase (HD superfamily)
MINGEKPEKAMFDRESAWRLLCEYTASESLRKHALAVEACMRAYARKYHGAGAQAAAAAAAGASEAVPATDDAGDAADHAEAESAEVTRDDLSAPPFLNEEEKWGITGLLHDFDYEKYPTPQEHPFVGNKILEERGYPEEVRRAILSHAEYSGVKRESLMEKTLFACDELAGFITATALVKPGKSLAEVEAKSVRKKMKDKAFARSVSRDDIVNGAQELGVELEEHIAFCIEAMKGIAGELGLAGGGTSPAA